MICGTIALNVEGGQNADRLVPAAGLERGIQPLLVWLAECDWHTTLERPRGNGKGESLVGEGATLGADQLVLLLLSVAVVLVVRLLLCRRGIRGREGGREGGEGKREGRGGEGRGGEEGGRQGRREGREGKEGMTSGSKALRILQEVGGTRARFLHYNSYRSFISGL